jgi:vancomycin permeability regulator SanA
MIRFLLFLAVMVVSGTFFVWGTHSYFFSGQQSIVFYEEEGSSVDFDNRVVVVLESAFPGDLVDNFYLNQLVAAYNDKKIHKIMVSGQKEENSENKIVSIMDYLVQAGVAVGDVAPDFYSPDAYHSCQRLKTVFSLEKILVVADHFRAQQMLLACQQFDLDVQAWSWLADKELVNLFDTFTDELRVLSDIYLSAPKVYLADRPINIFAKLYPY